MTKKDIKETDLYEPVKKWLESLGCKVRSEVKGFDVVGIMASEVLVGVELKKALNLEVINQSVERQKIADMVYIAVIHNSKVVSGARYKMTIQTLKRLSIGLLTVNFKMNPPQIKVLLEPKTFDFQRSRLSAQGKKTALIQEFHKRSLDLNQGGSTKTPLMTAYREMSLWAAFQMDRHGELSPKALVHLGGDPKKIPSMLQKNFYGWFERIKVGRYRLSEKGTKALLENQSLVTYFMAEENHAESD